MEKSILIEKLNMSHLKLDKWHNELFEKGKTLANKCISYLNNDPKNTIKKILLDSDLKKNLGAQSFNIFFPQEEVEDDYLYKWYLNWWGRRCGIYFSSLAQGFECKVNIHRNNPKLKKISKNLRNLSNDFINMYKQELPPGMSIERSLKERQDIACHHITYIDPILFSALYILNTRRDFLSDSAIEMLYDIIKREIDLYTSSGEKITYIIDESTLWWGLNQLIKKYNDKFKLGKYCGYKGFIKICKNLIEDPTRNVHFPTQTVAKAEATPEIYGEARTRLLILKNCMEIANNVPDKSWENDSSFFIEFIYNNLLQTVNNNNIRNHIYLIGISIEVTSLFLNPNNGHKQREITKKMPNNNTNESIESKINSIKSNTEEIILNSIKFQKIFDNEIEENKFKYKSIEIPRNIQEFRNIIYEIIIDLKKMVENEGYKLLLDDYGQPRDETICQILFNVYLKKYCNILDIDTTKEPDTGRGLIDFRFSKGVNYIAHIEIKKGSNPKLEHGLKKQLPTYMGADGANIGFLVIFDFGQKKIDSILKKIKKEKEDIIKNKKMLIDIIRIDAKKKISASKV